MEATGVASSNAESARRFADEAGIENSCGDYRELLADPSLDAVHICTPNAPHFAMAKERNPANCPFHNLRYYPVQNMRRILEAGELGEVYSAQGAYSHRGVPISEAREWDSIEYVRDTVLSGQKKGMVLVSHEAGEEAGMEE